MLVKMGAWCSAKLSVCHFVMNPPQSEEPPKVSLNNLTHLKLKHRQRERESVCVCLSVCQCVCICVSHSQCESDCECVRERVRVCVCACACVCECVHKPRGNVIRLMYFVSSYKSLKVQVCSPCQRVS